MSFLYVYTSFLQKSNNGNMIFGNQDMRSIFNTNIVHILVFLKIFNLHIFFTIHLR